MNEPTSYWLESLETALAVGQAIVGSAEELDQACEHVVDLLKDSSLLLEHDSHASSAFLSITALEESAKIHIGMYRKASESPARRKDPLYNHAQKHQLAAAPTVAMGSRLGKAIGDKRVLELIELARDGRFVPVRESALYVEQRDNKLLLPKLTISQEFARELLLFAVEIFDDALVGYTNHSYDLGKITDKIFVRWGNA